jgi:hypothetical protein
MPYNAHPEDPITVLRLMTHLEALWGFTQVYPDNEEETAYLAEMKKKYYKMYFRMKREEKQREKDTANETQSSSQ